jgi:hypothetical protein
MTVPSERLSLKLDRVADYIDVVPDERIFRVDPAVFVDSEIFELEMKTIFERTWGFLALESQLPNKQDYITGRLGRTEVQENGRDRQRLHSDNA